MVWSEGYSHLLQSDDHLVELLDVAAKLLRGLSHDVPAESEPVNGRGAEPRVGECFVRAVINPRGLALPLSVGDFDDDRESGFVVRSHNSPIPHAIDVDDP
ncbi:hypothetical protein ACFWU5_10510 [Nocardia sp. NPDC058640]|uniref:hypothetical protein n=1 Tax=Nocardia sp. NPDC058640 TaxID=3346571 RepID=UPI003660ED53